MRNVMAIADRELRSYFASPIAYVVIGFFALVFGLMYASIMSWFVQQGMQMGMGMDPTAGAASFLMQQSLASNAALGGAPGQGPSFDAALGEALQDAAKAVAENLKKADPKKK